MKLRNYCAPINMGNHHWVMVDVAIPSHKFTNGRVMITNHLHENSNDKEQEMLNNTKLNCTFYTQVWVAKYFGIYAKETSGMTKDRIHFGPNDMHNDKFCANNHTNDLYSSLDHYNNVDKRKGEQKDNFNCGI